ncbi:MAG: amylo-alpha-1,6-glucosidase [Ktedonobacteraceae bacterium]
MAIHFDRTICRDLEQTITREWIVTNGLGGYAAGTVAGVLTRAQHGLLVATLPHAAKPQLLLAKVDEEVYFDQRTYYLGTNEYRDGTVNPAGFVHLESFRLEDGFPVFTYHLGTLAGLALEKRIWMAQGHNTTYIQYRVLRTETMDKVAQKSRQMAETSSYGIASTLDQEQSSLILTLLPFVTTRPFDAPQRGDSGYNFQVQTYPARAATARSASPWQLTFPSGSAGCRIQATADMSPYHILAISQQGTQATFIPTGVWYWNFLHRYDQNTDIACVDDLYLPGVIRATLHPDEDVALTLIVSSEELVPQIYHPQAISFLYKESIEQRQHLLQQALQPLQSRGSGEEEAAAHSLPIPPGSYLHGQQYLQQLIDAGGKFLAYTTSTSHNPVQRPMRPAHHALKASSFAIYEQRGYSSIALADFYTLGWKTRDMLIALPGLTLITGRHEEARQILRTVAGYFIGGVLPDRLPEADSGLLDSDYDNVDIALWYFYALDHYLRASGNNAFLEEVLSSLQECIRRYVQGTRNGIGLDASDGLLTAAKPGKALTWMNASIEGNPVTQRAGKPVEVNALWYHALSLMHEWLRHSIYSDNPGPNAAYYASLATRCKESFQRRFWNAGMGYLYDVIDGPEDDDATLRVNQLFALSLRHSVLTGDAARQVFSTVTQQLLTPYGLRSLAPGDAHYHGQRANQSITSHQTQQILHQGSAWVWLIGPYIEALIRLGRQHTPKRTTNAPQKYLWYEGLQLLAPFHERFRTGILGACEAAFEGDNPHRPISDNASALSTAELLRAYQLLTQINQPQPAQSLA